jgi:hypothetical protein
MDENCSCYFAETELSDLRRSTGEGPTYSANYFSLLKKEGE